MIAPLRATEEKQNCGVNLGCECEGAKEDSTTMISPSPPPALVAVFVAACPRAHKMPATLTDRFVYKVLELYIIEHECLVHLE